MEYVKITLGVVTVIWTATNMVIAARTLKIHVLHLGMKVQILHIHCNCNSQ